MSKENKINYETLEEITVTSQAELDMIPDGFKGRIYIEFGVRWDRAVLARVFPRRVVARGNASVEARGNASVVAGGNVQVVEGSSRARIQISGNARIVYYPKNIEDFMNFYGIKHDKKTAIFYKAVHRIPVVSGFEAKSTGEYRYVSDHDIDFVYPIGDKVTENCDPDVTDACSNGIHISHLNWALNFGRNWADMAIIEVETKIDDIVLPEGSDGRVRTSCVKVLREVPLEECGVFGKILAKRRNG